jgi:CCR4-NOT transcription complex subunit 1
VSVLLFSSEITTITAQEKEEDKSQSSVGNSSSQYKELESILLSCSPFDFHLEGRSNNNNKPNPFKTGIDIKDILKQPSNKMSTNHPPNMTDDQIVSMILGENGGDRSTVITSDMVRGLDVTPRLCAKLLFALCKFTHGSSSNKSSPSMEEIDALANIAREFLPSASPLTDIIRSIDSEAFIAINDRVINFKSAGKNFSRFYHFCLNLCNTDKQGGELLGSLFFSHLWSINTEFQFGFIVSCIRMNLVPKLLSGAEGSLGQLVPQIDALKIQPDLESFPEMSNWRFQRLYQMLMDAVSSQSTPSSSPLNPGSLFYPIVIELMKSLLMTAPDLMALGLLGCSPPVTQVRKELLSTTIPSFLGNHPNAAVILHLMWSQTEVTGSSSSQGNNWGKQVLLQSMCDHYMKSSTEEQQSRLSRILDVAQDLKALSLLLNSSCYPFVIDLACLASRREYLKLDKWLIDKIQSNGEPFVQSVIGFLSKRCPALVSGSKGLDPNLPPAIHLPHDNLATLLHVLTAVGNTANLSKHVKDEIDIVVSNSSLMLNRTPSLSTMASSTSTSSLQSKLASMQLQQQQPPSQSRSSASSSLLSHDMNTLTGLGNLSMSGQQQRPPFGQVSSLSSTQSSLSGLMNSAQQQLQQNQQQSDMKQAFGDLARVFPEMQQNVSPEIEKEADTYFQRIYNHSGPQSMTIDEVLEMLQRFQDSPNQREKEIFTCMIRNLFKEYGYFPQYPDKELLITAQLFGGIIQMGLVKYMALVLALRYVLEALRKPHRSKMYFFGIAALDRFKPKLKDYPLYCQHLTSIPHFDQFPQVLIDYVRYGAQSLEPPNASVDSRGPTRPINPSIGSIPPSMDASHVLPPAITPVVPVTTSLPPSIMRPTSSAVGTGSTTKPSIAAADIATLLAAGETTTLQVPPEAIQDKIAFIINNLSQVNLQQKTEEFKELILKDGDIYYSWVAQYFVMKRASIELNFHNLYANFLDVLKIEEITKKIIRETFRNIKVLLRSSKEAENFSDRSLLKNLGHWLGMLTLAKSRPIFAVDIDIKKLLIEAYHKGPLELLWVVPFIAKILESTAKSKVFKPPNPWTMGILKALVELHEEPSLKLNLKFEVEVLCKTLSQDMHVLINESNCLSRDDLRIRVLAEPQLGSKVTAPQLPSVGASRDGLDTAFQQSAAMGSESVESLVPKRPTLPETGRVGASPPSQTTVIPSPGVHVYNYHDISVTNTASFMQMIVIPSNVPLFHSQPALKKFVPLAVDRAISEWVTPVIERSMKISIITVEKIIRKDFALEPDETVVCRAAHYLIRSLTAGMSMITCKEPLFISLLSNLVGAFTRGAPGVPKEMVEQAAHTTAAENIDLACCFLQKSAVEKATIELDKRLTPDYEARRKARTENRRHHDTLTLAFQMDRMPPPIRLELGNTPPHHFQVYEEIGRNVPGFNTLSSEPQDSSLTRALAVLNSQAEQAVAAAAQRAQLNMIEAQHQVQPPVPQQQPQDSGLIVLYDKLVTELESLAHQLREHGQPPQLISTMHQILDTVSVARQNPRDIVGAMSLIQRVLDAIQDLLVTVESITNGGDPSHQIHIPLTTRARDLYLVILKALADARAYGQVWSTKQITRCFLERQLANQSTPPLAGELFEILMKSGLINLPLLDATLGQYIEQAQSHAAFNFTFQYLKTYGPQGLHETDVPNIIMALLKLSKTNSSTSLVMEIQQTLEIFLKGGSGSGISQDNVFVPPRAVTADQHTFSDHSESDFQEKTERLLREWIQMYYSPQHDINKFFSAYVQQMNLHGILKTDDSITRFFQHSTELCVEFCFRLLTHSSSTPQAVIETRSKCFHTLDAFAHLILMLVKHSGSNTGAQLESSPKISLLNKVLGIIANVAIADQENRSESFQHLPYYRILMILFLELTLGSHNLGLPLISASVPNIEPLVEGIQFQVLQAFCQTLKAVRPSKCPSFAYAWLDFISHRTFLEKCLHGIVPGSNKGWPLYANLLMDLIRFLVPFLRCVEMSNPVELLYKVCISYLIYQLSTILRVIYCFQLTGNIEAALGVAPRLSRVFVRILFRLL